MERSYTVLFVSVVKLVRGLLCQKRYYEMESKLWRLTHFWITIVGDLGYARRGRDEMEVPFTFLAERYRGRSVVIEEYDLYKGRKRRVDQQEDLIWS